VPVCELVNVWTTNEAGELTVATDVVFIKGDSSPAAASFTDDLSKLFFAGGILADWWGGVSAG
jgi:hypothetical protein